MNYLNNLIEATIKVYEKCVTKWQYWAGMHHSISKVVQQCDYFLKKCRVRSRCVVKRGILVAMNTTNLPHRSQTSHKTLRLMCLNL